MRGGENLIIGVARAPVAIINFASNPCENLRVYIGFKKDLPHKKRKTNYCNRCAHPPQLLRFPPSQKPPFGNPQKNSLKIPNVYFWGTSVYFWGTSGVFGVFGIFFCCWGVLRLRGSGGPVGFSKISNLKGLHGNTAF